MEDEFKLRRDIGLKPRETGELPPEKLKNILSRIYPEKIVAELMKKLCNTEGGEDDGK